jgi:hypothetical protein
MPPRSPMGLKSSVAAAQPMAALGAFLPPSPSGPRHGTCHSLCITTLPQRSHSMRRNQS